MISRESFGWLAGIIDGEGCIGVLREKREGGWVYAIAVTVANTSPWTITTTTKLLQELGFRPTVYRSTPNSHTKNPGYQVRISAKQEVRGLLEMLRTLLVGKLDEVEMALWYLRRSCTNGQHKITDEERFVLDSLSEVKTNAGVVPLTLRHKLEKIGVPFSRVLAPPQINLPDKNFRKNVLLLEKGGIKLTISAWSKKLGIPLATIYRRKNAGMSDKECLEPTS